VARVLAEESAAERAMRVEAAYASLQQEAAARGRTVAVPWPAAEELTAKRGEVKRRRYTALEWEMVRRLYENTALTLTEIARRLGPSKERTSARAVQYGWTRAEGAAHTCNGGGRVAHEQQRIIRQYEGRG
jgi:hypothetical protein